MTTCRSCGFGSNFGRTFCVKCGAVLTVASETASKTGPTAPARFRQIWTALATCCAIVSVLAQPLVFGLAGAVASLIALRRKEPLALVALTATTLGVILGNLIDVMV